MLICLWHSIQKMCITEYCKTGYSAFIKVIDYTVSDLFVIAVASTFFCTRVYREIKTTKNTISF